MMNWKLVTAMELKIGDVYCQTNQRREYQMHKKVHSIVTDGDRRIVYKQYRDGDEPNSAFGKSISPSMYRGTEMMYVLMIKRFPQRRKHVS